VNRARPAERAKLEREAREQNVSSSMARIALDYNVRVSERSNRERQKMSRREREREREKEGEREEKERKRKKDRYMTGSRQETVNRLLHYEPRERCRSLNQRARKLMALLFL